MRRSLALLATLFVAACGGDDPTEPPPPPPPGNDVVSLAPGEAYQTSAAALASLKVEGPSGAEYLLVPFFGSTVVSEQLPFQLRATGIAPVQGPPSPSLGVPGFAPSFSISPRADRAGRREGWDARLREIERRELSPRIGGGMAPQEGFGPKRSAALAAAALPELGDTLRLNVQTDSACANPDYRTGSVVAISNHAVVVSDVDNPAGGFTADEYREIARRFDELVWPLSTETWGAPTDIDGNNRVILFYSRAVSELTCEGGDCLVGGFVFNRDLFPQQESTVNGVRLRGCQGSNFAEMFYMLAPDPTGGTSGLSKEAVFESTIGVLAHEFQHLISGARRLYIVKATGDNWVEETWLNEGLSHIAEELLFYRTSGLAPRQNIDANAIRSAENGEDAFFAHQVDNVLRLVRFLENPDTASVIGRDLLPTRGASWSFLRYAADRKGGDQNSFWFNLVNTSRQGLSNVQAVFGFRETDWVQDWATSVYTDDAASVPVQAHFTQPSWNFRDLLGALRNQNGQQIYPQYPLRVTSLTDGTPVSFNLYSGGAAYVRFGMGSGGEADISLLQGGTRLSDEDLQITIVRTK